MRRCCIAAACLVLSLSCSAQAAAEAAVRSGDEGSSTAGILTGAAAPAALEITYSDDRGAVRQLLARSDSESPEVWAIPPLIMRYDASFHL